MPPVWGRVPYPGKPPGTGTLNFSIGGPATNDDCTTPSAIAGQGQFPYNLFGATTGTAGQTEYACVNFGTSAVDNDVWFEWTSNGTGVATVSACGGMSWDPVGGWESDTFASKSCFLSGQCAIFPKWL